MAIEVRILPVEQLEEASDALASVYLAAFAEPPYFETEQGAASVAQAFLRHRANPAVGFRCCVAREPAGGEFAGFIYGFAHAPGTRRYDLLQAQMPPELAADWLADAYDVVELAVAPDFRRQGIGGRLLDALLAGQPHRTAVLTTYDGETAAMRLYRARGWTAVMHGFRFPGGADEDVVLGLRLKSI
jgi:ribosomal protein S18 acetylase RimI-like enzyme